MDAAGDYIFGKSNSFLVDSPACVAQAILTRLRLATGEWFLDDREGTDYEGKILGTGTQDTRDVEIRTRILQTPGVQQILTYASSAVGRRFSVSATVQTIYGGASINVSL